MTTDLAQTGPDMFITQAIDKGMGPEQLQKLLDMKFQYDREEARKLYNVAMVETQAKMKTVQRDAQNKQTSSQYSRLETIIQVASPVWTAAGLSLSFYEGKAETAGDIRTVCDILHADGHTETRFVDFPPDVAGIKGSVNKTGIHAKGSTFSYGRRYLTCMIFNIPTGDDNDGNGNGSGPVNRGMPTEAEADFITAVFDTIRDDDCPGGGHVSQSKVADFMWAARKTYPIGDASHVVQWVAFVRAHLDKVSEVIA